MTEILTTKETVSFLRKSLKVTFPGVKFSVRTDRGGISSQVRVAWEDGPTTDEVEAVTDGYAGDGFDGMIDMAYSRDSWLAPDGRAYFAGTEGTQGSMGVIPASESPAPVEGCRRVRFCLGSVSCVRTYSRAAIDSVVAALTEQGAPEGIYTVRGSENWGYNIDTNARGFDSWLYWRDAAYKAMDAYKAEEEKAEQAAA